MNLHPASRRALLLDLAGLALLVGAVLGLGGIAFTVDTRLGLAGVFTALGVAGWLIATRKQQVV